MIHFVGAGPGAADLITLRGKRLIGEADVIIYTGSLVNPELLSFAREDCEIHDSARLTLPEVLSLMKKAEAEGKTLVRLHTGDPSIYGAIREQMDELEALQIPFDSTPGVSSFLAAAASLNLEYTLPGVSQTVILTRMEGKTKLPEGESPEALAKAGGTMVFFLSAGDLASLSKKLITAGKKEDTPCALCYKVSREDEKTVVCELKNLAKTGEREGIDRFALVIVGEAVTASHYERSRLYAPDFSTAFRKGTEEL